MAPAEATSQTLCALELPCPKQTVGPGLDLNEILEDPVILSDILRRKTPLPFGDRASFARVGRGNLNALFAAGAACELRRPGKAPHEVCQVDDSDSWHPAEAQRGLPPAFSEPTEPCPSASRSKPEMESNDLASSTIP